MPSYGSASKVVKPPFLPPLLNEDGQEITESSKIYTLVLDLDETLVHYSEDGLEGHFLIRPGSRHFLEEMAKFYEIIIFTAALQDYADWVLDQLDPNHTNIKYRLYREHTQARGVLFLKDLTKLGRDLKKLIIIDNVSENFALQPENGIFIKTWIDDIEDDWLFKLIPLLKAIVE